MADQKILREYLLSLGFRADPAQQKKFTETLTKTDASVASLGKGLVGVAAAAATMVTVFAYQMEKLYYASRRANSTAEELRGLGFAGKQVGLGADAMTQAVGGMAMKLRSSPGLTGLLESFGIAVKGRTTADVAMDLFDTLKAMPFPLAKPIAEQFGIGDEQLFQILDNLDKLKAAYREQIELDKQLGINASEAAKQGVEYARQIGVITQHMEALSTAVKAKMLPIFKDVSDEVLKIVDGLTKVFSRSSSWKDVMNTPFPKYDWSKSEVPGWIEGKWNAVKDYMTTPYGKKESMAGGGRGFVNPANAITTSKQAHLAALEQKYGLPAGLLDRMWAKESNRGDPRYQVSKAGAQGDFQFMPKTAKEYGVDVSSFESSADGAARYMRNNLRKYGGNLEKALAAYNWGPGNVDALGLGQAPAETRDYMKMAQGLSVQAPVTININGVQEPKAVSTAVQDVVQSRDAELVRNLAGALQ